MGRTHKALVPAGATECGSGCALGVLLDGAGYPLEQGEFMALGEPRIDGRKDIMGLIEIPLPAKHRCEILGGAEFP